MSGVFALPNDPGSEISSAGLGLTLSVVDDTDSDAAPSVIASDSNASWEVMTDGTQESQWEVIGQDNEDF